MKIQVENCSHILSKSTYVRGCKCEKSLWLYKHHYHERNESEAAQAIMQSGTSVGEFARTLFPEGVLVQSDMDYPYRQNVKITAQYLEVGHKVIYEAHFQYQQVLCAVDILVCHSDNSVDIYEVKSSTSVKDYHKLDLAVQYWILQNCGIKVNKAFILTINNQYVRMGDLEVDKLFVAHNLSQYCEQALPEVEAKVAHFKAIALEQTCPAVEVGNHCNDFYSCDFSDFCHSQIATPEEENQEPLPIEVYKDEDRLRAFLDEVCYPMYFMDFETLNDAIPPYDYSRPYQQLVYQFSVHIKHSAEDEASEIAFLGEPNQDNRIPFIEQLIKALGNRGTIWVYNSTFEKTRLNEIARDFPQYQQAIEKINDRIKDLLDVFRGKQKSGMYFLSSMGKSASIKVVLPALLPELSYEDLNVQNGLQAGDCFRSLDIINDSKQKAQIREDLLRYCQLDTFAMVKIYEKLCQIMS